MARSNVSSVEHEVVAAFINSKNMKTAITDLKENGFSGDRISLVAGDETEANNLNTIYQETYHEPMSDKGPAIEKMLNNTVGETHRNMIGAIGWYSVILLGAVILVVAGLASSPWLAAFAAAPAIAAAVAVLSQKLRQSDAEHIEEQLDQGNNLLCIRVDNTDQEIQAKSILHKYTRQELTTLDASVAA